MSANGFQWYEVGIFHGLMMEYIKTSGDNTYATETVNAITAGSYGTVGNFLGSDRSMGARGETHRLMLGGKWNDDLLWWSYASLTGAEVYGKDVIMPGGVSYLQLTDRTYKDVIADQDDVCGKGGVYWIRALQRTGKSDSGNYLSYKSSITNAQAIAHGARLGILTGDKKYFAEAEKIVTWFQTSGVMSSEKKVYDGVRLSEDGSGTCTTHPEELSYKAGTLAGALAWLYEGTKDQKYLTLAHEILDRFEITFTKDGIVSDPCEREVGKDERCERDRVTPKGTAIRGLGYLYEFTNDEAVRDRIKLLLKNSVQAMMTTCDEKWNCLNDWAPGSPNPQEPTNVHFAMNSMELMTAYLKTFNTGPVGKGEVLAAPTTSGADDDGPIPEFSNAKTASYSALSAILALGVL
jgi:mannan endo-1,6-alpha-mannosidase